MEEKDSKEKESSLPVPTAAIPHQMTEDQPVVTSKKGRFTVTHIKAADDVTVSVDKAIEPVAVTTATSTASTVNTANIVPKPTPSAVESQDHATTTIPSQTVPQINPNSHPSASLAQQARAPSPLPPASKPQSAQTKPGSRPSSPLPLFSSKPVIASHNIDGITKSTPVLTSMEDANASNGKDPKKKSRFTVKSVAKEGEEKKDSDELRKKPLDGTALAASATQKPIVIENQQQLLERLQHMFEMNNQMLQAVLGSVQPVAKKHNTIIEEGQAAPTPLLPSPTSSSLIQGQQMAEKKPTAAEASAPPRFSQPEQSRSISDAASSVAAIAYAEKDKGFGKLIHLLGQMKAEVETCQKMRKDTSLESKCLRERCQQLEDRLAAETHKYSSAQEKIRQMQIVLDQQQSQLETMKHFSQQMHTAVLGPAGQKLVLEPAALPLGHHVQSNDNQSTIGHHMPGQLNGHMHVYINGNGGMHDSGSISSGPSPSPLDFSLLSQQQQPAMGHYLNSVSAPFSKPIVKSSSGDLAKSSSYHPDPLVVRTLRRSQTDGDEASSLHGNSMAGKKTEVTPLQASSDPFTTDDPFRNL